MRCQSNHFCSLCSTSSNTGACWWAETFKIPKSTSTCYSWHYYTNSSYSGTMVVFGSKVTNNGCLQPSLSLLPACSLDHVLTRTSSRLLTTLMLKLIGFVPEEWEAIIKRYRGLQLCLPEHIHPLVGANFFFIPNVFHVASCYWNQSLCPSWGGGASGCLWLSS